MTLGENLQKLRKSAGLSQEEVAGRLFVSRQSVSKWENDQAEPGVENLKALAALYGVTMDQLTGMVQPHSQPYTWASVPNDMKMAMGGLGRLFGDESSVVSGPESARDREKRETSFYRGVVWIRTTIVLLLNIFDLLSGGRFQIPFDWLFMLAGLKVRKAWVYWTTIILVGFNLAVAVAFILDGTLEAILLLAAAGAELYLYTREEIRGYFHLPEKKEGDQ